MDNLVSVSWLKSNISLHNLVLLDASIEISANGDLSKFENLTIPKSRFFDIKSKFSDLSSKLPNTIPSPEVFETNCRELGIQKNSQIVVFDNRGVYSSPRVWWLFKIMGHEQVAVLDGGLPHWISEGNKAVPLANKNFQLGDFEANFDADQVVTYQKVKENILKTNFVLIDARSEGRFKGMSPEPRANLLSGSIPLSLNIPFANVLEKGKYKLKEGLLQLFKEKGIVNEKLVFSCGSGLTACIVLLAFEITFSRKEYFIYDGSWTEWALLEELFRNE